MSQPPAIASTDVQPPCVSAEAGNAPGVRPEVESGARSWGNEVGGAPRASEIAAAVRPLGTSPSTTTDDHDNKSRACRCNYKVSGKMEGCSRGATARSPAVTSRCQTGRTWVILFCIIVVAGGAAAAFSYYNYYPVTAAAVIGVGEGVIDRTHADIAVAPQAHGTEDIAQCACVCAPMGPLVSGHLVVDARGSHCACPCKLPEAKEAAGVCSCDACALAFVAASLFIILGSFGPVHRCLFAKEKH